MESMALIKHTRKIVGPAEAKLHWSGFCANLRLGGSGGMLPQENFRKCDPLRWLLRPFWGLKTSLGSLHISLGMVTICFTTTHMEICVHRHWWFQVHLWNQAKKWRTNASQYFVAMDLATPIKNVWAPRSQFACFQVSAVLFYTRTAKFVRVQICAGDMHVSRLQAKDREHHLSQNIGPAFAGSARPAPPALLVGNECVKETVPLKLFKVQSLRKKWAAQAAPASQLPMAMPYMPWTPLYMLFQSAMAMWSLHDEVCCSITKYKVTKKVSE